MSKILDYLDISIEHIDRIKKARKNLNIMIHLLFLVGGITHASAIYFLWINFFYSHMVCLMSAIIMYLLGGILLFKREIYSLSIEIKEGYNG